MKDLTITINVLDYWLTDNYKLGSNNIVYVLMQVDDCLSLKEIEI